MKTFLDSLHSHADFIRRGSSVSKIFSASGTRPEDDLLRNAWKYALSLAHHEEDAEDLVQQAVYQLHRAYGRITPKSLLYTTIRNLFFDRKRRQKIVRFEPLADGPEPEAARSASPGAKGDVGVFLQRLAPDEREVIFLHYAEGRSAAEIGELLGRSRNTVLSQIRRTCQKLRGMAERETELKHQIRP